MLIASICDEKDGRMANVIMKIVAKGECKIEA